LLDLVSAGSEQREDAIRPAHVSRSRDHEVDVAAAQIALDFRNPIAIARIESRLLQEALTSFIIRSGLAYATKGRHRAAVTSFERAIKIMPNYKQAWEHLATEYRAVGRSEDAQRAAARAAQLKFAAPGKSQKKS